MSDVLNIGNRREVLFDDWLIDKIEGLGFKLHHPQPEEVVMDFSLPWE